VSVRNYTLSDKTGNMWRNVTLGRVRVTIGAMEAQQLSHYLSVTLLTQHGMHMNHFVKWSVWLYLLFPHYLFNGTTWGKKLFNIKCAFLFFLHLLSETFLTLRRIERGIVINVGGSSCKVPVILVSYWWKLNFLDRFSKNTQMSRFMKTLTVGTEFFNEDGRTDRQTWRSWVAFLNLSNAPKGECTFYAVKKKLSQQLLKEGRKDGRRPVKRESQQLLSSDPEDGVKNLCRKVGNLSMNLQRSKSHNIYIRQHWKFMYHYICEAQDRLQLSCGGSALADIVSGTYE
jgi:hypothetical protein